MRPREIDGAVSRMLESIGVDRYYCDFEEDITYVDNLALLGNRLGCNWTSQAETGIYNGYWFRQLGVVE